MTHQHIGRWVTPLDRVEGLGGAPSVSAGLDGEGACDDGRTWFGTATTATSSARPVVVAATVAPGGRDRSTLFTATTASTPATATSPGVSVRGVGRRVAIARWGLARLAGRPHRLVV